MSLIPPAIIRKIDLKIWVFLLILLKLPCPAFSRTPPHYVISYDGEYCMLDPLTGLSSDPRSLWTDANANNTELTHFPTSDTGSLSVGNVIPDNDHSRVFVQVDNLKLQRTLGYLVLNAGDLRPLRFISQQMQLNSSVLKISPRTGNVFLTYLSVGSREWLAAAIVLDGSSYEPMREYANAQFTLRVWSCFFDSSDKFVSDNTVFRANTGSLLATINLVDDSTMPIGCENGRVLLVSRTRDHLGLLRLFDIATNKTITTLEVREHATLLLQDEWFFDGQSAIAVNNEHKLVTVGQSKMLISTGKLSAFDLARGKPINSIDLSSEHPSEGRIAGFDASLGWLFYGVRNKLYVINIGSMKVVKALDVPVSAQFVLSQSPREN